MADAVTPFVRRGNWSLQQVEALPGKRLFEPDPDSVAGTFEGVLSHRAAGSKGPEPLVLAAALLDLLRTPPTTATVHAFAGQLIALDGPAEMDRFLEAARVGGGPDRIRLAELARWLCTHGVHYEQVTAGLALLGISGDIEDVGLVMRLGVEDRLTLYALVALQNLLLEPEQAMFELARRVKGWDRIDALYRLKDSTDPTSAVGFSTRAGRPAS